MFPNIFTLSVMVDVNINVCRGSLRGGRRYFLQHIGGPTHFELWRTSGTSQISEAEEVADRGVLFH